MRKIKALLLDIGGVLLTNGWDRHMRQKAAEKYHLDEKEISERHAMTFDLYEIGRITLDEYLEQTIFYKQRDFSIEEFKAFMLAQSQPYPEMLKLIREIKESFGLMTIAVNNEGRELNEYRIEKYQLREIIDFFVSSCYVHMQKPNPDIFSLTLDCAQLKPSDALYIDDRLLTVQMVQKMGILGLHHRTYEETAKELLRFFPPIEGG